MGFRYFKFTHSEITHTQTRNLFREFRKHARGYDSQLAKFIHHFNELVNYTIAVFLTLYLKHLSRDKGVTRGAVRTATPVSWLENLPSCSFSSHLFDTTHYPLIKIDEMSYLTYFYRRRRDARFMSNCRTP